MVSSQTLRPAYRSRRSGSPIFIENATVDTFTKPTGRPQRSEFRAAASNLGYLFGDNTAWLSYATQRGHDAPPGHCLVGSSNSTHRQTTTSPAAKRSLSACEKTALSPSWARDCCNPRGFGPRTPRHATPHPVRGRDPARARTSYPSVSTVSCRCVHSMICWVFGQ